jgi:hypothetical protein
MKLYSICYTMIQIVWIYRHRILQTPIRISTPASYTLRFLHATLPTRYAALPARYDTLLARYATLLAR